MEIGSLNARHISPADRVFAWAMALLDISQGQQRSDRSSTATESVRSIYDRSAGNCAASL